MKKITIQKAHQILTDCSALIIDDNTLVYPSLADLEGSDDNEFLYLSWTDEEGRDYSVKFSEGQNKEVTISGSSMFLVDNEGEEAQITILAPQNLEV